MWRKQKWEGREGRGGPCSAGRSAGLSLGSPGPSRVPRSLSRPARPLRRPGFSFRAASSCRDGRSHAPRPVSPPTPAPESRRRARPAAEAPPLGLATPLRSRPWSRAGAALPGPAEPSGRCRRAGPGRAARFFLARPSVTPGSAARPGPARPTPLAQPGARGRRVGQPSSRCSRGRRRLLCSRPRAGRTDPARAQSAVARLCARAVSQTPTGLARSDLWLCRRRACAGDGLGCVAHS